MVLCAHYAYIQLRAPIAYWKIFRKLQFIRLLYNDTGQQDRKTGKQKETKTQKGSEQRKADRRWKKRKQTDTATPRHSDKGTRKHPEIHRDKEKGTQSDKETSQQTREKQTVMMMEGENEKECGKEKTFTFCCFLFTFELQRNGSNSWKYISEKLQMPPLLFITIWNEISTAEKFSSKGTWQKAAVASPLSTHF